ncbi:uncharacterized protein LOC128557926 [Mercenaria mercenaria]|uniref:uncharacterized protein LOC128557926 n=1 Tax=Mercenaria mercenaria TaxID=6596 RepID=UPI00234EBCB0|nr:uncharacterized protein LOC128557926 [Mercenaria mercenaria]
MYLCGDFNSRCSDNLDYIPGIDRLTDRDVIDFSSNQYGDVLTEFLINVNFCILNGRNTITNNFTFVGPQDASVVDYCLIPYENLSMFVDFEVLKVSDILDSTNGYSQLSKLAVPDHSLLKWNLSLDVVGKNYADFKPKCNMVHTKTLYDTKHVGREFLADPEVQREVFHTIDQLESAVVSQVGLNEAYDRFVNIVHVEMSSKLEQKVITISANRRTGKKLRVKKPWWSEQLTVLWTDLCKAEKSWLKCKSNNRQCLKHVYVQKRKAFDSSVQRAKRQYVYQAQSDLEAAVSANSRMFWKSIGNIGIGNERLKSIPFEVKLSDGSISTDPEIVLKKWGSDFAGLLNSGNTISSEVANDINIHNVGLHNDNSMDVPETDHLDSMITIDEILKCILHAKSGKAPGYDNIPCELLKNDSALALLQSLFNRCFISGTVPTAWSKSIITPIPKCSTSDPRDPLSYRGITLAPSMYKIYCAVLNNRLAKWTESNNIICDEQNGFVKGKSTIDQVQSLTTIIETRKLKKLPTFTAFIDFKKAYDLRP